MKQRGITLIEMVAVIVVAGVAIPALFALWADVTMSSVRSSALADAAFEAASRMEEIKSKRFSEDDSSTGLGPETGESYATFDDVDDFDGFSLARGNSLSGSVDVSYAALSGASWTVSAVPTDFKLVTVSMSHSSGTTGSITMSTIISKY